MRNLIIEYQKVYQQVTQTMSETKDILASFVFGSMVTGDLWENSDIDFFVIYSGEEKGIRNVYSSEDGVPVHFKIMSKGEFMTLRGLEVKGSFLHRIFLSSKMVFSKDPEITTRYNNARFYPDMDRRKWTLSYLGRLIKSIDSTDKFLHNRNLYGAFNTLLESMELYASVYVNSRGYLISKDTISIVAGLDKEFSERYLYLVSGGELEEKIKSVNKYLKKTIDKEITEASEIILTYFREKSSPMSAREIIEDDFFNNFEIQMEGILSLLHKKNLLKRSYRAVKTPTGKELIKENVYSL
ncbi:nucleotidyltransferase domain-containing protein [Proteiniclasticum sp.]|uniref:nucleotidyltransferase domain-containing protein n=1 Tax=Proteiniclasticum sp. TaxID=2053595 RepID=UPI0028970DA0|nr:nucleotidyltransferase domain-containing protein [Proteiniclasticum sp.]